MEGGIPTPPCDAAVGRKEEGGGGGGIHGGGLADKNYPFKVEKRYKSVVKVAPQKRATY